MRFSCEKCKTQYTVADERIRGKVVKFRCKQCNAILVVRDRSSSAPPAVSKSQWYFGLDGNEKGPFSLSELRSKVRAGEVAEDSFVWQKGTGDWVPLEDVPELTQAVRQAAEARKQVDNRAKMLEREREAAIRSRKQAEERRRQKEERGEETKTQERQIEIYQKRREEKERKLTKEKDAGRQELLQKVLKRREKARADRHADRIASHFFDDSEAGTGGDGVLPAPAVSDAEGMADRLDRESIQEEHEALQHDPLAVLVQRDKPGLSEISKVSKVIAVQAGMGAASKGRRFTITLLCVVGVLAILGGGIYLAVSQDWFGGVGSVEKKSSGGRSRIGGPTGEVSEEEAKRLRDTLWNVEKKPNPMRRIGLPGFDLHVSMEKGKRLTAEEKKLQAFYRKQGEEKRELTPRVPDRALLPTPQTIDLPTAPVGSIDAPLSAGKTELTPTGPKRISGPGRLSDFQVRVVIQKHYQQVKSCLERQLKRNASISGMLYVVARVNSEGKVERASIATPKFHGTFVEECLIKEVRRWEFPTFKGETYDIAFPLLLTAQQTY